MQLLLAPEFLAGMLTTVLRLVVAFGLAELLPLLGPADLQLSSALIPSAMQRQKSAFTPTAIISLLALEHLVTQF